MPQSEVTFKPGDIVTASFSFSKDKPEDLSFSRNEELQILDIAKDPNWAHAANAFGETGLIPLNYVQLSNNHSHNLKAQRWYHGRISRMESEKLLSGYPPGSFLIRDSDLFTGDLTLCVVGPINSDSQLPVDAGLDLHRTNVQHYHILCKPVQVTLPSHMTRSLDITTRYSLDEIDWFTNLLDLVQYYSVPDSGLVAPLKHPVPDIQRQRLHQLREQGWIISRKELNLGDVIGRGEFGEVLRATYRNSDVAVKMYKKTACKLAITYEAMLMTKLNHPNLVAFVGFVYEPEEEAVYLVTEYLALGNLLTYLHSRTREEVNEQDKVQFCIDVCRGLAYLEERRIVHRDVAARNVLLSGRPPRLTAKLADFGMARDLQLRVNNHKTNSPPLFAPTSAPPRFTADTDLFVEQISAITLEPLTRFESDLDLTACVMEETGLHESPAVPVKWTAPEAVQKRLFSNKSDVWSFGVLMWEIYSFGRIPYPRMMANQALRQILAGYRMKAPEGCPAEIYQLMRRTWHINPDERPTFAKLLPELSDCLSKATGNNHMEVQQRRSRACRSTDLGLSQDVSASSKATRVRSTYIDRQSSQSPDGSYDRIEDFNPALPVHIARPNPPSAISIGRSYTTIEHADVKEQSAGSFCLPTFERVRH